jgi:hypothetical protein
MGFLMNSQKADLHLVLNENNFNYDDFEIVASTARTVGGDLRGDAIRLKETGYYFAIYPNVSDYTHEKFLIEFSPGKEQITEHDLCGSWDLVVYAFVQYLSFLRRELSTIDPWADVEKFSNALNLLPTTVEPNASTSEVERRAIWKALTAIQATLLIHAGESREKQEFIKQHFEILENAATKFGRKDYLMLVYTTIIGVAATLGVPSHLWAPLLQPLLQVVGNLLKLLH